MNDSSILNIRQAQARLENKRESETVGENIKLTQAIKELNGIVRTVALGEMFEAGVPEDDLGGTLDALEDELGVGEGGGGESADGSDAGEREERERRRGFDEVGMELFELKW